MFVGAETLNYKYNQGRIISVLNGLSVINLLGSAPPPLPEQGDNNCAAIMRDVKGVCLVSEQ